MSRTYTGPMVFVAVQHPAGVWVEAERGIPVEGLDDAGDLGPDWTAPTMTSTTTTPGDPDPVSIVPNESDVTT